MSKEFFALNNMPKNKTILSMRKYAIEHKVPIITDEGLIFLLQLCRILKPKNVLELGTAIGFSSVHIALELEDVHIDTIERNQTMVLEAKKNVEALHLENKINVIEKDIEQITDQEIKPTYDLIFIDAAKAQYVKFFERFSKFLSADGIIVSDNLLFHGLVETKEKIQSRNVRNMVQKIKNYNEFLAKHKSFTTSFFPLGDGMAVSERKKT